MITAVDSVVLLDVLVAGSMHGDRALELLDRAAGNGPVIVAPCVPIELAVVTAGSVDVERFLAALRIDVVPLRAAAWRAGAEAYGRYVADRAGQPWRCPTCGARVTATCSRCWTVVHGRAPWSADFEVGGHALVQADCLLTRNRPQLRAYFPQLRLIGP